MVHLTKNDVLSPSSQRLYEIKLKKKLWSTQLVVGAQKQTYPISNPCSESILDPIPILESNPKLTPESESAKGSKSN